MLGEHTTAASAYVGMTRGRQANTAHLVAGDLDEAREQWMTVFGRDRADLGPAHAAREAAATPLLRLLGHTILIGSPALVEQLDAAWTEQAHAHAQLRTLKARRDQHQREADLYQRAEAVLAPLREQLHTVRDEAQRAEQHAASSQAVLPNAPSRSPQRYAQRGTPTYCRRARSRRRPRHGMGRLGIDRGRVRTAQQQLEDWVGRWQPACGDLLANRWLATAPDAFHPAAHASPRRSSTAPSSAPPPSCPITSPA